MKDLRNIREEWGIAERIAFYVREFHPEVFESALDAMYKEDLEKYVRERSGYVR